MMLILKFLFKFNLGFNIANKIKIITKWKKNLPQITWFKGIIVPRYFAVESWQTKIKKPVVAKNITFNKDVFWFFDIKIFTLDLLIIVTHYAATSIKLRLFINLLYNY